MSNTNTNFEFSQIDGHLSPDQVGADLVRYAQLMQESFLSPSIEGDKSQKKFFFENRKAGINALMDLIGEYIDQIPE